MTLRRSTQDASRNCHGHGHRRGAAKNADVTLVKGNLRGIVRARVLSVATVSEHVRDLLFAFIYNSIGVPVAAGVLYPFFGSCCRRSSPPQPCR